MGFGGHVHDMITSLKRNALSKRITMFDRETASGPSTRFNRELLKEPSEEALGELLRQMEHRRARRRKAMLIAILVALVSLVLMYFTFDYVVIELSGSE